MHNRQWKRMAIWAAGLALLSVARPVQAQMLVQAIGGMTKTAETKPVFAAAIGGKAGPVELGVEGGHFHNIAPKSIFDATQAATGGTVDADMPAWYGMGNIKLIAKRGAIQPFVQAGAGAARLHPELTANDPRVTLSSQFGVSGDTTKFLAGAGAGLRVKAQKLILEGGYRYIRIFQEYHPTSNINGGKVMVNVNMFYVSAGLYF